MRVFRRTLILTLIGFCLVLSPVMLSSVYPSLEKLCPSSSTPEEYQLRDGNRCEGIKSRLVATSYAKLASVTLKPNLDTNNTQQEFVFLKVNSTTEANKNNASSPYHEIDTIVIQEFRKNYRLDNFQVAKEGAYWIFQWPTKILNLVGIKLEQLHATAIDDTGTFAPVIISPSKSPTSLHYEFGIFDEEKFLKLIYFEIKDMNNQQVYDLQTSTNSTIHQHEFITINWNGKKNDKSLKRGIYSVTFKVEERDENGVSSPPSRTYKFLHDPSFIR